MRVSNDPAHASRDDHERGGAPIGEGEGGGKRKSRIPPAGAEAGSIRLHVRHALGADAARGSAAWTLSRPARWPAPTATNTVPGRASRSLDPARPGRVAVGEQQPVQRRILRRLALVDQRRQPLDVAASTRRRASAPASRRARRFCSSVSVELGDLLRLGHRVEQADLPSRSPRARRSACGARCAARVSTVSGPSAPPMPSRCAPSTASVIDTNQGSNRSNAPAGTPSRGQRAAERRILLRASAATESVRPLGSIA